MAQQAFGGLKTDIEGLNLKGNRPHPFIKAEELFKIINTAQEKLQVVLDEMESHHPNYLSSDGLLEVITELFSNKVGIPYSQEELDKKYEVIKIRYSMDIPPGYEDVKSKKVPQKGDPEPKAYGDAILWMQMLDFIESEHKPLIFVTGDVKSDWWLRLKGKTIGARPELRKEMLEKAQSDFHMYQTHRFIELAQRFLKLERQDEAVNEIRELDRKNHELDLIVSNWPIILRYVGSRDETLRAYLSVAKLLDFSGSVFTIGFDFLAVKEKFEKVPLAHEIVKEAISVTTALRHFSFHTTLVSEWKPMKSSGFDVDDVPF